MTRGADASHHSGPNIKRVRLLRRRHDTATIEALEGTSE